MKMRYSLHLLSPDFFLQVINILLHEKVHMLLLGDQYVHYVKPLSTLMATTVFEEMAMQEFIQENSDPVFQV